MQFSQSLPALKTGRLQDAAVLPLEAPDPPPSAPTMSEIPTIEAHDAAPRAAATMATPIEKAVVSTLLIEILPPSSSPPVLCRRTGQSPSSRMGRSRARERPSERERHLSQ
jgi:hypothetical protein